MADAVTMRSRRALLLGAAGGLAAVAAQAIGRPLPAHAASGTFDSAASGTPAVSASNTAANPPSLAVLGQSTSGTGVKGLSPLNGVWGESTGASAGVGVVGRTSGSTFVEPITQTKFWASGVEGMATKSGAGETAGVRGLAVADAGVGVLGQSPRFVGVRGESFGQTGSGVMGFHGPPLAMPPPSPLTGVFGAAFADPGTALGVLGQVDSDGIGVKGLATKTTGATKGVLGEAASPDGIGVKGLATATSGFANGVWAETKSSGGNGVFGLASATTGYTGGISGEAASPAGAGTWGIATAGGTGAMGVSGSTWPDVAALTGAYGVATQTSGNTQGVFGEAMSANGTGVVGESSLGRGGRFKGGKAQIRLVPSTATTHPASGQAGDIFLDKSKRLWLCKGAANWVRIV